MVIVAPVPEVTSIPAVRPLTAAPGSVVTVTAHALEARIAVPCADVIAPRAVMRMLLQPGLVATMPLEPGPVTVTGPAVIVWSPLVVVTLIPSELPPVVVTGPASTTTGPVPPRTSMPSESVPPVVTDRW